MSELAHIENAMTMHRPWTVAEGESLWEITGRTPGAKGTTFIDCIAVVLPDNVTGGHVLFKMIGALDDLIRPDWITSARPLLLVLRNDPTTAYYTDDQEYLR